MLNYKIYGKGKPVVFLHGFLESISMWEVFELEKFPYQSILIDLPGHGDSQLGAIQASISEVAKKLHETLEQLNISDYDLIGHSLGAYVAIELHKLRDNKGKLVLYHSNFWEDSEEKKHARNRVIEIVQKNKNLFIKEAIPNLFLEEWRTNAKVYALLNDALKIDKGAIIFYSKAMRDRMDNEEYILQQKENVFVIQGENDRLIPNILYNKYKDLILISEIKNTGHMSYIENFEGSNEILKNI
jgi:pimeloyl-ACP methyl ester carboxylesterase